MEQGNAIVVEALGQINLIFAGLASMESACD
jgi:hypothetical protein